MSESGTILIATDPPTLWRYLTTIDSIVEWYDDWSDCSTDSGLATLERGTCFRLSGTNSGQPRAADYCVVSIDEPRLMRWIEAEGDHPPTLVEFHLEAHPDGSTMTLTRTTGTKSGVGVLPQDGSGVGVSQAGLGLED